MGDQNELCSVSLFDNLLFQLCAALKLLNHISLSIQLEEMECLEKNKPGCFSVMKTYCGFVTLCLVKLSSFKHTGLN